MDKIIVNEIACPCRVGVTAAERAVEQQIIVDIELSLDLGRAAAQDDIAATVDYGAIYDAAGEIARARPYKLIESAAAAVAEEMLKRFPIEGARVRVRKRRLADRPEISYAAAEIEKIRDG